MNRFGHLPSRALLVAAFVFAPLAAGSVAAAPDAAACHGNAVSRVCLIQENLIHLESLNYDPNFFDLYAWQYVESWYYYNYSNFLYGDNTCIEDWSCDHGIWEGSPYFTSYQVSGAHRLNHDGNTYNLAGTWTDGQCFPSESDGC